MKDDNDSEMTASIEEAIREKLPGSVGEVLRTELKAYAKLKEEAKTKHAVAVERESRIRVMEAENLRLQELELHSAQLDVRKMSLDDRERKFDNEILKIKLNAATARADEAVSLVGTVFRSPVFTKSYNHPVALPGVPATQDPYHNGTDSVVIDTQVTETTEQS